MNPDELESCFGRWRILLPCGRDIRGFWSREAAMLALPGYRHAMGNCTVVDSYGLIPA